MLKFVLITVVFVVAFFALTQMIMGEESDQLQNHQATFKAWEESRGEYIRHRTEMLRDSSRNEDWITSPANVAVDTTDEWEQRFQELERRFDQKYSQLDNAWENYVQTREQEWNEFVQAVEAKWGSFRGSTETEWVGYSPEYDARTYVNFKEGFIVVDALVPTDEPNPKRVALERAKSQIRNLAEARDRQGLQVLDGQIPDEKNRPAPSEKVTEAAVTRVIAELHKDDQPVKGSDSVTRNRYTAFFPLVPNHLKNRASRYAPIVAKYCREHNIDPALVMAIIHTESYFNPMAQSAADAHGLMQIVPKYAGRDTENKLYGTDRIPSPNELYDPDENIKRGCCYLGILYQKQFSRIPSGNRQDYLVISAYNCGPGRVNRNVVQPFKPIERKTSNNIFQLCQSHLPSETSDYLSRVTSRRKLYKPADSGGSPIE